MSTNAATLSPIDGTSVAADPSRPSAQSSAKLPNQTAELVAASRPFAVEQPWRSWTKLLEVLVLMGTMYTLVAIENRWWVSVLLAVAIGMLQVRLFIFYHDWLHGAIFRNSRIGDALMGLTGLHLLAVPSVWQETHDYHHQHNAKLVGSQVGSYPLVSIGMLSRMTPGQRRIYYWMRHPLLFLFGYLFVFAIGMSLGPLQRDWRKHGWAAVAVLLHAGLITTLVLTVGWQVALCAVIIPMSLSSAIGSYLFYAQHNYPDVKLRGRREWNYGFAATHSSSMFDMGPLMHWLTGSIGYHHVHHLNHRIPFYRLKEAMQAIPGLQNPGRTSWRPADIMACLRVGAWDPELNRVITWAEVRARLATMPVNTNDDGDTARVSSAIA